MDWLTSAWREMGSKLGAERADRAFGGTDGPPLGQCWCWEDEAAIGEMAGGTDK